MFSYDNFDFLPIFGNFGSIFLFDYILLLQFQNFMHAATYFDFKEIQNFELFAQFLVFYFFFSAAGSL